MQLWKSKRIGIDFGFVLRLAIFDFKSKLRRSSRK